MAKKKSTLAIILKVIKKRVRWSSLLMLAVLLSFNSFAWFIYATKISSGITAQVRAWNILFETSEELTEQYITFEIDDLYPGMANYEETFLATNRGDTEAEIGYEVASLSILGRVYEVTEYVSSEDLIRSLQADYPFVIDIGLTNTKLPAKGGTSTFYVRVNWPYESGDDEADTYWGNKAYDFHQESPDESSISIVVKVAAIQAEEVATE